MPLTKKEKLLETGRKWYKKNVEREKDRSRVFQATRRQEVKKWINEYKKSKGCCKCGEDFPACLDFHHFKGIKKLI